MNAGRTSTYLHVTHCIFMEASNLRSRMNIVMGNWEKSLSGQTSSLPEEIRDMFSPQQWWSALDSHSRLCLAMKEEITPSLYEIQISTSKINGKLTYISKTRLIFYHKFPQIKARLLHASYVLFKWLRQQLAWQKWAGRKISTADVQRKQIRNLALQPLTAHLPGFPALYLWGQC